MQAVKALVGLNICAASPEPPLLNNWISTNISYYYLQIRETYAYKIDISNVIFSVFIPRHTLVSGYYVIPFGVCPSVRPSVLTTSDR